MKPEEAPEAGLIRHIRESRQAERSSFHMPGHKGGSGAPAAGLDLLGQAAYEFDVSELAGFDYLHGARRELVQAQAQAAELFGATQSWFLVNGATVGNLAALCATVADGDSVLVARGSHRSVYAGLSLSGARPMFLSPVRNEQLDALVGVDPAEVEAMLRRNRHIRAVHVTSPSMYGFGIPLEEIAEVVARFRIPLIVDEAHGTHFALHGDFPKTALACGADVVIHSPHKALGSLTQSALMHHQGELVDAQAISQVLQELQSSSPSALLLASLAASVHEMARHGEQLWGEAIALAERARADLARRPPLRVIGPEVAGTPGIADLDPVKLVVDVSGAGFTGYAAGRWLRARHQINPETADLRKLVFSITMGDSEETIEVLLGALAAMAAAGGDGTASDTIVSRWPAVTPYAALSPRAAAAEGAVALPLGDAVGHIAAEMVIPYPPGVPLLVPGELITPEEIGAIAQLLDAGSRIVGMSDPQGLTLRCVDPARPRRRDTAWPGDVRRRRRLRISGKSTL